MDNLLKQDSSCSSPILFPGALSVRTLSLIHRSFPQFFQSRPTTPGRPVRRHGRGHGGSSGSLYEYQNHHTKRAHTRLGSPRRSVSAVGDEPMRGGGLRGLRGVGTGLVFSAVRRELEMGFVVDYGTRGLLHALY
ncbi:hypothetical protein V490_07457 [Pseudogymnoascus sp. VKM F-3557]|nr:hypothetical protein V490_07457 [Pseudogymnoascus sp. VKM F-3557]